MTSPRLRGRPKGYVSNVTAKRNDLIVPLVPVLAKCPACSRFHTVMLGPKEVEAGKVPRIFCEVHKGRRYFSGNIFELPGHIIQIRARHGVAI
jgi:hypothetical protein